MSRKFRERFPRQRLYKKPLVNDPDMHHGTLTRDGGETFPAFMAHVQPIVLLLWKEAHWQKHFPEKLLQN